MYNIDFATLNQAYNISGNTSKGFVDFGDIRIQWIHGTKTGLKTGANTYDAWDAAFEVNFRDTNYSVTVSSNSDVGGIAGCELKVIALRTNNVSLNFNHIGAIASGSLTYSIVAIGRVPLT